MSRRKPKEPYRSNYEEHIANNLETDGIRFSYEEWELPYYIKVEGGNKLECAECGASLIYKARVYTPDFYLEDYDIFIEAKGKFTAADRKKMLAVRESHPHLDIRFMFMRDNKIHRKSTTRYSDWAKQKGFQYTVGTEVPVTWRND